MHTVYFILITHLFQSMCIRFYISKIYFYRTTLLAEIFLSVRFIAYFYLNYCIANNYVNVRKISYIYKKIILIKAV